jgi:hypothetical protein
MLVAVHRSISFILLFDELDLAIRDAAEAVGIE